MCGKEPYKTRNSKEEVKQEFIRPVIEGEKYKTKNLNKLKKCENTVSIKRLYENITKIKKKKILSYRQNLIFKSFIEKHNFIIIIKHFGVTKPKSVL